MAPVNLDLTLIPQGQNILHFFLLAHVPVGGQVPNIVPTETTHTKNAF